MTGNIRARLTVAYAALLFGTMVAFAVTLWLARRAEVYRDLERKVLTQVRTALTQIRTARERGDSLTTVQDSLVGPTATSALRRALEGVPEYLMVLDTSGRLIYNSYAVRELDPDAQSALQTYGIVARPDGPASFLRVGNERLLVAVRENRLPGAVLTRVVAGASTSDAEVAPRELVGTMIVLAPLILVLSLAGAYVIAGSAFRPLEDIMNEVEAITDGRSLHRRLPVGDEQDELARLSETLNAMMARLETSFSALRRFTADASHELKTPLTVLRADVERAMHAPPSSTEQLVALEEALQETTRMADLVEGLLTLARADEGRFDLHREPVALEPLVRDVFETAVILGEDAGLTVLLPVAEEATVQGDEPRLRQLFLNLITNAIKYTPRGGRVELSLSQRDAETVSFTVRDTGIGIAAADLPHVFDRFWRADRVRTRRIAEGAWTVERGGSGLGLAICQWIAQAHGGTITASSRLGRGSTFVVTLPVSGAAPSAEVVPDSAAPFEPGTERGVDRAVG